MYIYKWSNTVKKIWQIFILYKMYKVFMLFDEHLSQMSMGNIFLHAEDPRMPFGVLRYNLVTPHFNLFFMLVS